MRESEIRLHPAGHGIPLISLASPSLVIFSSGLEEPPIDCRQAMCGRKRWNCELGAKKANCGCCFYCFEMLSAVENDFPAWGRGFCLKATRNQIFDNSSPHLPEIWIETGLWKLLRVDAVEAHEACVNPQHNAECTVADAVCLEAARTCSVLPSHGL